MLRFDINLLFTVINVLILFFVVWRFLLKPINKILDQRKAEVEKQYADADEAKELAERAKESYEKGLADMGQERSRLMSESQAKASREYENIIATARSEAETILSNARINGEEEKRRRIKQASEEIAVLVTEGTAKLVASKDSAENDKELLDEFLRRATEDNATE
ncbi:MAG: ATP synthase F0 subunit B [Lachnospiraceae bacterium]|nr:ATP synthase F0 subunit B [Lachnospiraceae bacterium]